LAESTATPNLASASALDSPLGGRADGGVGAGRHRIAGDAYAAAGDNDDGGEHAPDNDDDG
jgi:hypothetical protein